MNVSTPFIVARGILGHSKIRAVWGPVLSGRR